MSSGTKWNSYRLLEQIAALVYLHPAGEEGWE